ncbi:FUSC family protein [Luteolibacter luteus]|uniref:Integral membrane bound transporter domain-containing protein n=1 Tax=Luteolibacter luteus TaxID=2728835 RepID=A0A858RGM6_9BACT|nr:FUSC family protein [Luteolibacter luteus]QJE96007.1 hypothetical protein HHL09_09500 [Luteolibacter luteus]
MSAVAPGGLIQRIAEQESLRPDLNRAIRGTVAFMVPLLASYYGGVKIDPAFACIAAHTISLVDVRGAYSFRLGLLLGMTMVLVIAVVLGTLGSTSLPLALLGTVLVALGSGLWRHLSSDYGAGLAVSTGLMFFVSLSPHVMMPGGIHPAFSALGGALFGVLSQIILWPIHPQHPMRRTVAESWIALADLLDAMASGTKDRNQTVAEKQADLRAALNQSQATLAASSRLSSKLLRQLELLNLAAARLAMRVIVFNTAVEAAMQQPAFKQLEASLAPAQASLGNAARMVALAAVSRQPSHLAAFEVRLARLENLLTVLQSQIRSQGADSAMAEQLVEIIGQITAQLPIVHQALRTTVERADERTTFSMELFDLQTLTLRPLASSLNFSRRVDPALVRHTLRIMVLSLIGVLVFKLSGIPHGYWLPFTMIVVLQPDFGSTRKKAAERVIGTLAGGLFASSLLWLRPDPSVIHVAVAATIAIFSYLVKRRYGVAVFFITLVVVLLMEAHQPVTIAFTIERMACTLGGGLLALVAAFLFWPVWERGRFPGILSNALARNRDYLRLVADRLKEGGPYDEPMMDAKKEAESANADAFSSLRRMSSDPKIHRAGLEQAAALANGNQRVTNALNVIAVHLNDQVSRHPEFVADFLRSSDSAFGALEESMTKGAPVAEVDAVLFSLESFRLPEIDSDHRDASRFREPWVYPQIARIVTELGAMILAAKSAKR